VESVALKEEHKIVFDRLAFSDPSPKASKTLIEEEWKTHVEVVRFWDVGNGLLNTADFRKKHGKKWYGKVNSFKVTQTPGVDQFILKRSKQINGENTWRMVVHEQQVFDLSTRSMFQLGTGKLLPPPNESTTSMTTLRKRRSYFLKILVQCVTQINQKWQGWMELKSQSSR
jgi:hypothetical protein